MTIHIPKKVLVTGLLALLLAPLLLSPQSPNAKAKENDGIQFIAVPYQDVVRFKVLDSNVAGEATSSSVQPDKIRVQVFNLAGQKVYDGEAQDWYLDWDKTSEGENVANGVYLWVVSAWVNDEQVNSKVGKLGLFPGGVKGEMAPVIAPEEEDDQPVGPESEDQMTLTPETQTIDGDLLVTGNITSQGTQINIESSEVIQGRVAYSPTWNYFGFHGLAGNSFRYYTQDGSSILQDRMRIEAGDNPKLYFGKAYNDRTMTIDTGNRRVGIGTKSPSATWEVRGDEGNLLALYASGEGSAKFRVTNEGDVYANEGSGVFYGKSACGSADVAERINTSEWVEPGNVVEIDSQHPGFFRKTRASYSTNVAGVISTSPGVVLGNNFDAKAGRWDDNRPLLALAGRVPVKVTTENGSIEIGDLLVSSSKLGYAMKCTDQAKCVGATIAKALESLKEGSGTIMAQVILR